MDKRDVLLKAAEDVSSGMWCREAYFDVTDHGDLTEFFIDMAIGFTEDLRDVWRDEAWLKEAAKAKRCAEGSLMLVTALLEGNREDYLEISREVNARIDEYCDFYPGDGPLDHCNSVIEHNDSHMKNMDVFEAGQFWAEVFRDVADKF